MSTGGDGRTPRQEDPPATPFERQIQRAENRESPGHLNEERARSRSPRNHEDQALPNGPLDLTIIHGNSGLNHTWVADMRPCSEHLQDYRGGPLILVMAYRRNSWICVGGQHSGRSFGEIEALD